jgi:hypothetical protein
MSDPQYHAWSGSRRVPLTESQMRPFSSGHMPRDAGWTWSEADVELLRELFAAGGSDLQLGVALGRSVWAIRRVRSRLGIIRSPKHSQAKRALDEAMGRSVRAGSGTLLPNG